MPKKFGTNTKKEEAREKEAQKKKEKRDDEIRKAEDAYWKETDEKVNKKLEKEKEAERKRQEALKRKQENKDLVEKEMSELQSSKKNENKAPTRREIEDHKERTLKKLLQQHAEKNKEEEPEVIDTDKEFVNPNFINNQINERGIEIVEASGLEDALSELTMNEFDKHPEKRMRAAWNAYFEKQLPIFKAEYPNFTRGKLINMIQKEFKKSPDNPIYKQQLLAAKELNK